MLRGEKILGILFMSQIIRTFNTFKCKGSRQVFDKKQSQKVVKHQTAKH